MNIQIKQREVGFCNIKVLLIFMVVYGHLIETRIDEFNILMVIYKLIYSVHMPMFVFLSGYFLRSKKQCFKQAGKAFVLYFILQWIMFLAIHWLKLDIYVGNTKIQEILFETPFWHLWYLLSLSCWAMIGFLVFKREPRSRYSIILILGSIVLGCLAGYFENINREYSLSRTFVFLPFFFLGLFLPKRIVWHQYQKKGVFALFVGFILFLNNYNRISYTFLWQIGCYGADTMEGVRNRLVFYLIAFLFGFFILTNIPQKRFVFSKVGADTMNIYLWHVFPVMALNRRNMDIIEFLPFTLLASIVILYFIYKIFKWNGQLYSIPQRKRESDVQEELSYGSI